MVRVDLIVENHTEFPIVELEVADLMAVPKGFKCAAQRKEGQRVRCSAKSADQEASQSKLEFRPEVGLLGVEKVCRTSMQVDMHVHKCLASAML